MAFSILRHIGNPIFNRLLGRFYMDLLSIQQHFPALNRLCSKQQPRKLCPARSEQSSQSEDLSAPQLKGNILQAISRQVCRFQHHIPFFPVRNKLDFFYLTVRHLADQLLPGDVLRRRGQYIFSVAHHGHPVRDPVKLFHSVGYVDNRYPVFF